MNITLHDVTYTESISDAGQEVKLNFTSDDMFLNIQIETETNHNASLSLTKEQVIAMARIFQAYIPLINEIKE